MKKIPTLFVRDWHGDRGRVTREVNPECQWVLDGEGVPTRKWDGTAVLVKDGLLYKRYELRPGKQPPEGFAPAQEIDTETGKQPGWVPAAPDSPADRYLFEAFDVTIILPDGTYELVGPKVNGNADGFARHLLRRHGDEALSLDALTYDDLAYWLERHAIEGIVWHHPDGRMAKLKRRDFGLPWPAPALSAPECPPAAHAGGV